jgi:hypothetical protein
MNELTIVIILGTLAYFGIFFGGYVAFRRWRVDDNRKAERFRPKK